MSPASQCPVCQARFRGTRVCSRCGADLGPLMVLAVRAWRLRELARRALVEGDVERALDDVLDAQQMQRTDAGESLRRLCEALSSRD